MGEMRGRGLEGGYWREVVVREKVDDLGFNEGRS